MVVCIPHRPTGAVPTGFLAVGSVDEAHVAVHPIVEMVGKIVIDYYIGLSTSYTPEEKGGCFQSH